MFGLIGVARTAAQPAAPTPSTGEAILTESGDTLVTEGGDRLVQE